MFLLAFKTIKKSVLYFIIFKVIQIGHISCYSVVFFWVGEDILPLKSFYHLNERSCEFLNLKINLKKYSYFSRRLVKIKFVNNEFYP